MKLWKPVGISVGLFAAALRVHAVDLYSDSTTDLGDSLTFTNSQEIGDQIFLGDTLTPYVLTNFAFEFYTTNTAGSPAFAGNVQAEVKFYMNDGTAFNGYATPGTVFFDSGLFEMETAYQADETNTATIDFDSVALSSDNTLNLSGTLPTNFTFTVTFTGLDPADQVGLELFDPATVGGNYGDYWLNNGGTWVLMTNTVPTAFGALFQGVPTPEPSVFYLAGVGGLLFLGLKLRRMKFHKN